MRKYSVVYKYIYTVEVEAESESDAIELADEVQFIREENGLDEANEIEVEAIELI